MKLLISSVILGSALTIAPVATLARGANAHPGGASASHLSAQGLAHSNGPNAADRDKGLPRAEDRRSASGLAHNKATHAGHGKKKKNTATG